MGSGMSGPTRAAPMRVLHVLQHFGIGGVQTQCVDRLNLLPDHIRQDVAAINGDLSMRTAVRPRDNVRFLEAPAPRRGRPYVLTLLPWLRRQDADLVVSYGWGTMDVLFAAPLAGVRHLLHEVHGFGPAEIPHQLKRRLWARRLMFRSVSRLVVPSRTMQRVATDLWHLPPAKVAFLPCAIDTNRFRPAAGPALRARLGIANDAFVVGSVGRLDPVKDPGRLVEAIAGLDTEPEPHLVLVGDGGERTRLEEQAARLGVRRRVHFAGFQADTAPWYGMFDAYALSSRSEQRPVALMEAMACALPVAATDVGDVAEMLSEPNRRFVVPRADDAALRAALVRLQREPQTRRRLGLENRRRCEAEFDMHHLMAAYQRLYETTLGRGPKRGA